MTSLSPSDLHNLKQLLDSKDKANRKIGVSILVSHGVIPSSVGNCIETKNIHNKLTFDVTKDGKFQITLFLVSIEGHETAHSDMSAIDHIYQIKNLINFKFSTFELKVPSSFVQLNKLKILDLEGAIIMSANSNKIKEDYLFDIVTAIPQLESLRLYRNTLDFIPSSIKHLKELKQLDFSGNNINTLPESIKELEKLESLNLSYCKFKNVPEIIGQLKKLRKLRLGKNTLELLPEALLNLKNLEELSIYTCNLENFPTIIPQLKTLKKLTIGNNHINTLPENFLQLKELEELNITKCSFEEIPEIIYDLPKLKTLKISSGRFSQTELQKAKLKFGENLKMNGWEF